MEHLVCVFPTELDWMAVAFASSRLVALTIGHSTEQAAARALPGLRTGLDDFDAEPQRLVDLLTRYAAGEAVSFAQVRPDLTGKSPFQRAVIQACRKIPRGAVRSYGQLATAAGSPGAARAVGTVMRTNRLPLIVPCHRVIGSGNALGGYSGPSGLTLKRRLLMLEGVDL